MGSVTLLSRVLSVTGTFWLPVADAWLVFVPATITTIWWPALNVCSVGIVGNLNVYSWPIVTGVASANHSESRFDESRMPRVTRHISWSLFVPLASNGIVILGFETSV